MNWQTVENEVDTDWQKGDRVEFNSTGLRSDCNNKVNLKSISYLVIKILIGKIMSWAEKVEDLVLKK